MASTIDFSTLTLNNEEARSLSEVIQEQVYSKPELTRVHNVQTGVEMDKYIPILGKYTMVGKVDPGSCGVNAETGTIPTSEKTWTPKLISGRLSHCQADIDKLLKFWKMSRKALGIWEDVDNEMMAFISDRVRDVVLESIFRITEFGDTGALLIANGGHITAGSTIAYWTMLDGMWKQIFTDQALGTPLSHRYTITENAEATYAAQLALAADRAYLVFCDLYENADSRIFDGNNPVFQVTKSLFDNWQAYTESKSVVWTLDRMENGNSRWNFRGVPIIVRADWDRQIRTYHDDGAAYYLPHRAVLTDINNIPVGTSDTESLSDLDSFYDKTLKTWYIDFAYKIDQKNLQEALLAVAY